MREQPNSERWSVGPEGAWRLLTEPMNAEEARQAANAIRVAVPHVDALPVDPRRFLVLAWDRADVEMHLEALRALAAAGRPVPSGMVTDLEEWLQRADADSDSGDVWPSL
ncbi:hypothetical protein [Nocardioides sp. HB32]